jgi:hypothetical protein
MGREIFTRRELLRLGGTAHGASAVAATAGCLGVPCVAGFGNCRGAYVQWLPEPGAAWATTTGFRVVDYSSLADQEDEFDDETDFDEVEQRWEPADVDWEDVSMGLAFHGVDVVDASFDRDDVIGDFEDEDFDAEGDHGGYEVLLGPDERAAVGVGDGTLVTAGLASGSFEDPPNVVETVVDARSGDEDRYDDEVDSFGPLTNALGDGDIISAQTMDAVDDGDPERGRFENVVASGFRHVVDGSTTDGKWVFVFEEGDDVDTGDVENWIEASEESDGTFSTWEDASVGKNGRKAVVTTTADTDEL